MQNEADTLKTQPSDYLLAEPLFSIPELVVGITHPANRPAIRLLDLALQVNMISKTDLAPLKLSHDLSDIDIAKKLRTKKLLNEKEYACLVATTFNLPLMSLVSLQAEADVLSLAPADFVREHAALPITMIEDKLIIAVEEPINFELSRQLEFLTGKVLEYVIATRNDIEYSIARFYGPVDDQRAMADLPDKHDWVQDEKKATKLGQARPTIQLVHNMIIDAINSRASDIHIRPREAGVELYFRIDGSLVKIRSLNKHMLPSISSRIKIMGEMNIAEHRLPQDGQARVSHHGVAVDLRISIIPSIHGESVVIRILDKDASLRSLSDVGFTPKDEALFASLVRRSHGMILVTGPTGCGKSTTLYAALQSIRETNVNIITVEDPVEYHIDGITQIQVNHETGYDFSRALRHILRHDPDVVMVGEIRDKETAKMAVESSLTGHIVLSTLHTNSAATTVTRLLEIGIAPYLVNTSLLAVLAQRLVRKNCPECTEEETIPDAIRKSLGIANEEKFYKGKGCSHCYQTGYFGRAAVYELMVIDANIRQNISDRPNADLLEQLAVQNGMVPLTQMALSLARDKITSLEEVHRVKLY